MDATVVEAGRQPANADVRRMQFPRDLAKIADKVLTGTRIDDADALTLLTTPHVLELGALADFANQRRNSRNVYFNINRHINPTNICALSCQFCSFARKIGEDGAYAYSIDEILAKAEEAVNQGATEVHMVGGLHPRWPFKKYAEIIQAVKTKFPALHIKAFTAVELDWMARRDRRSVQEILADLVASGLGSLPGGGAEIFHPEIREKICDTKVPAERWLEIHRIAHGMGLFSNATMLYGHIESFAHRVDHMRRLRELQDETRGFNAFIPLSFQPYGNDIGKERYTAGLDDLRTVATARLYLDNFANIKAYWVMLGQDIAQVALRFGANDLDGTVTEEKISRMAGGRSGIVMGRTEIEDMIRNAGSHPVERDTVYHSLSVRIDTPAELMPALSWRQADDEQDAFGRDAERPALRAALEVKHRSEIDSSKSSLLFTREEAPIESSLENALLEHLANAEHANEEEVLLAASELTPMDFLRTVHRVKATLREGTRLSVAWDEIPSYRPMPATGKMSDDPRLKLVPLLYAAGVDRIYTESSADDMKRMVEEEMQISLLSTSTSLAAGSEQLGDHAH